MTHCSLTGSRAMDIAFFTPGFIAAIIGIVVFVLAVKERRLVGSIALLAAISDVFFFLGFAVMPASYRPDGWVSEMKDLMIAFGFYCTPLLFMCLALLVSFPRNRQREPILLFLCVSALIASVAHTFLIWVILAAIASV